MPSTRDIQEEVAFVSDLKGLVTAYEEIAVMRIERARDLVLAARRFREGLSEVFTEVRTAHKRQVAAIMSRHQERKPQREAAVLLSTNTRLSGRIISQVAEYFVEHAKRGADLIVVGQTGKEHVAQLLTEREITVFQLPNNKPTARDLEPLITHLLQYQSTTFYYGRFRNLVQQEPTSVTLGESSETAEQEATDAPSAPPKRRGLFGPVDASPYISEPGLDAIVDFFNKQIFAILVQQTIDESWLSLLGSRITAMEQAALKVQEELKALTLLEQQSRRTKQNREQRDSLAGISLWQTT